MAPNRYPIEKSEVDWQAQLDPESYRILREKGTEYPHSGKYNQHFEAGTYHCKGCGTALFAAEHKFESNCGWPSFDAAFPGALEMIRDTSHGMIRIEIVCAQCGGHQGHVFPDGPTPTGERFCVNSASIDFVSQEK